VRSHFDVGLKQFPAAAAAAAAAAAQLLHSTAWRQSPLGVSSLKD